MTGIHGKKKKNKLAHVIGDFHRKVPGFAGTRKSPASVITLRIFHKELEKEDFSFFSLTFSSRTTIDQI